MLASAGLLLLLVPAFLIVFQMRSALGVWRGSVLSAAAVLLIGSAWGALEWTHRHEPPPPEDLTDLQPVQARTCFKCHESHNASWQRTYHRTMTREATPENVKGDFNNAVFSYLGVTSRMTRQGDRFFMETADPQWVGRLTEQGIPLDKAGEAPRQVYSIDRLVGSHWFQQMLHRDEHGRYSARSAPVSHRRGTLDSRQRRLPHSGDAGILQQNCCLERELRLLSQHPAEQEPRAYSRPNSAWLSYRGGRIGYFLRGVPRCRGTPRPRPSESGPADRSARLRQGGPDHRQSRPAVRGPRRRHLRTLSRRPHAAHRSVESDHPG